MNYTVTTPPTKEAVLAAFPLARAKSYSVISHSRDDGDLTDLLIACYMTAETYCRSAILTQTIAALYQVPETLGGDFSFLDTRSDPDNVKRGPALPRKPVTEITKVELLDVDAEVIREMDAAEYRLDGRQLKWKTAASFDSAKIIRVTYVAGYALESLDIAAFRIAIYEMLSANWENKGLSDIHLPSAAKQILNRYWTPITRGARRTDDGQ